LGDDRGSGVNSFCMSAAVGDLDGDGLLDLYLAGTLEQFALVDSAHGYFDMASSYGWEDSVYPQMPWGAQVTDVDNDGLVDVVVTTSDFSHESGHLLYPIMVHHQVERGVWQQDSEALGLTQEANGRGLLLKDLNEDGVLDLYIADFERSPWLYLSDGCTEDNWIEVTAPSGSLVQVEADGQVWVALATRHASYGGHMRPTAHIGLGEVETLDRVTVTVPWVGEKVLVGPVSARSRLQWGEL
ncbi:MAG: VCBS repeat-containing protein, partial [Myxococcota bacterium]|nr:VCBS repeat-containing protein [Myxococcota bacterium]